MHIVITCNQQQGKRIQIKQPGHRAGQKGEQNGIHDQKIKIRGLGYEITAKGFHNIAPSVESAINYLKDRYGADVKYRIAINAQAPSQAGAEGRKYVL